MAQQPTAETSGVKNSSLGAARRAKNDEFYTQLTDIEKELVHYKTYFKDKVVFLNCDDPTWSNFWKYFTLNFRHLGLKKVIATHYAPGESSYKREYSGEADLEGVRSELQGDGDFRSAECLELLKQSDVVVTNPPFSLFREYIAQLIEHKKRFLVIGSQNALTYKDVFRLLRDNQIWFGNTKPKEFKQPDGTVQVFGNIGWYTNLSHSRRNEEIVLFKTYTGNESAYPKYANYDAIEVGKVADIPVDYTGHMGVPITFMDRYNPEQFQIIGIGIASLGLEIGVKPFTPEHKAYRKNVQKRGAVDGDLYFAVNGEVEVPYRRIIIKHKSQQQ